MANNPNQLRAVAAKFPLRVFGVPIAIKKGEAGLKETLDNATRQLLMNGTIDKILSHYEKYPGSFLRVTVPYEDG